MSELIVTNRKAANCLRRLLCTASVIALIGSTYAVGQANASDDPERPTVWIELGGQLERGGGAEESFVPPFLLTDPRPPVQTIAPQSLEHPAQYSNGGQGKISISPVGTDWTFSAAVKYGRSNAHRTVHQQSYPGTHFKYNSAGEVILKTPPNAAKFSDTDVRREENHLVLDFQAGKDVGMGLFGGKGSSVVSVGVRFAQFHSKSNTTIKSDPDWHFTYKYIPTRHGSIIRGQVYHSNYARESASRNFVGVGPQLSWSASAPFAGSSNAGEVTFDWGMNAALLFGRQKALTYHQTTARYHAHKYAAGYRAIVYQHPATPDHTRANSVVVPNIGGFAGFSFRYINAKVKLGYRADFFWGAMDGGIDGGKKENQSFYGPFATISVGIGG